jgi:hypothetical protein
MATIAFHGPNASQASRSWPAAAKEEEPREMREWRRANGDVRNSVPTAAALLQLMEGHGVPSVVMFNGIIGCPQ